MLIVHYHLTVRPGAKKGGPSCESTWVVFTLSLLLHQFHWNLSCYLNIFQYSYFKCHFNYISDRCIPHYHKSNL